MGILPVGVTHLVKREIIIRAFQNSAAALAEKRTAITVACCAEVNLLAPHCAAASNLSARIVVTTLHYSLNIREGNSSPSVLKAF